MKTLLAVTGVLEGATGLALVARPSWVIALLLGVPLEAPEEFALGRVAGVALIALGLACWLARLDAGSRAARGLIGAMLLYNAGVFIVIAIAGLGSGLVGIGLWPVALGHALMFGWCTKSLVSRPG
jgi:hypothetical protein